MKYIIAQPIVFLHVKKANLVVHATTRRGRPTLFHGELQFPEWIRRPYRNNITADSIEEAFTTFKNHVNEKFTALNRPMREIKQHSFYVHRAVWQCITLKKVMDSFVLFNVKRHSYAISENVEGIKYHRSNFAPNRGAINMEEVFEFINDELIISPLLNNHFSFKFVRHLIKKNNNAKASTLRIYNDPALYQEPKTGYYYVPQGSQPFFAIDKRNEYYNLLIQLKSSLIMNSDNTRRKLP